MVRITTIAVETQIIQQAIEWYYNLNDLISINGEQGKQQRLLVVSTKCFCR